MNKLTPDQINDMVVANETADETIFQADLKLYRRMFPHSKIINDLERANEFTRKALDGRMLKELLKEICITTIHENRLKLTMKAPKIAKNDKTNKTNTQPDPANNEVSDKLKAAQQELLAIEDIATMKYNKCKSLLLRLGLKVAKNDTATIMAALNAHKQQLLDAMPKADTIAEEVSNDAAHNADANLEGEKKSADQE